MAEEVIGGRYRLEQRTGHGGMSEVWLATDLELDRPVALKLLAPNADRQRFEREARAAATLSHPNINQLFGFGETEGRPYMVLEYLPGGTLEEQLDDGHPLPDEQTARIARDLAAGLAHAHAHGLVHRDLKPANVLFDGEGRAKIADFGIARLADSGTLTEAGTVLGTAAYISPEQAAGEPATPASDVYSFGVILFRMLTGRLPFESDQPMELVELHRDTEPPSVDALRSDVPPRLESLVAATLAKDPADRPPDGAALLAELGPAETAAMTQVLATAGAPPRRRGAPPRRRIPRVAVLAALMLAAAAGVGLAFVATRPGSSAARTTTTTAGTTLTTTTTTTTTAEEEQSESTGGPGTAATTTTSANPTTTHRTPPASTFEPLPTDTAEPPTTEDVPTLPDTVTTGTTTELPPP